MPVTQEQLDAILGQHPALPHRLREVEYSWVVDGMTVSGKFFYLPFRGTSCTTDLFAKYIYDRIVPFCIPQSVRQASGEAYLASREERYIIDLFQQATRLFVRARQSRGTSGEPAELILFILIEWVLRAPQIACKMYLKTSRRMHVHGSDSIHVRLDASIGGLEVIWGESKLYADVFTALEEICSSVTKFLDPDDTGEVARERDLEIIKDHMTLPPGALRDAVLAYSDPYSEESNIPLQESFACFVGFDYDILRDLDGRESETLEAWFKERYAERIAASCSAFGRKLTAKNWQKYRFYFFLLPFPSVLEFREIFFAYLDGSQ